MPLSVLGLRSRWSRWPLAESAPEPPPSDSPFALTKDDYEAIVVSSGFGGAVAACRLAQAGVDLAVLDRGRRFEAPARGWPHLGGDFDGGCRPLGVAHVR